MATKRSSSLSSSIFCEMSFQVSFEVSSTFSKGDDAKKFTDFSSRKWRRQLSMFSVESKRSDSPCKTPHRRLFTSCWKHLIGHERYFTFVLRFVSSTV